MLTFFCFDFLSLLYTFLQILASGFSNKKTALKIKDGFHFTS